MKQLIPIFLLVTLTVCLVERQTVNREEAIKSQPKNLKIWPQPKVYIADPAAKPFQTSPCGIKYTIQAVPTTPVVRQMLDYYLNQVFKCPAKPKANNVSVIISVKNTTIMTPSQIEHEAYEIVATDNLKWSISAKYYPGFIRALQTFSQIFQENGDKVIEKMYSVNGINLYIEDKPDFKWRGLLIDTSLHYLPVQTIKHTIDGLMFNHMNVLHWHIIDFDSFPYVIPEVPQLADYGKLSQNHIYTPQQINDLVSYANKRAIRIIPEIDTPAHTRSWGLSQKYKDLIVQCKLPYSGQFDPTLDAVYLLVQAVMKHTDAAFPDSYVHFGGDQIQQDCWDTKPSIKQWMKQNNISDYFKLQEFYRRKQKSIFRQFSAKKTIYWANQEINIETENDDVIQWWGQTKDLVNKLSGKKNEVILSNYDITYLDVGFGDQLGNTYRQYITWRKAYQLQPNVQGLNVIGGEACIWGQLNNQYTIDAKTWIRASAIGERLWNSKGPGTDYTKDQSTIVMRLVSQQKRLRQRGFKVSAISVQLCQINPEICFNGTH